jgi:hypothetical protein
MDRVGFEPTTSAQPAFLVPSAVDGKIVQLLPGPHLTTILGFQMGLPLVAASHQEQ